MSTENCWQGKTRRVASESRLPRGIRQSPWRVGVLLFLILAAVPGLFSPSCLLISLAACSLLVVTLPLLCQQRADWFSMWNFVLYVVLLGFFVRAVYITFDIPDSATIQRVFLLGQGKDFLLLPAGLILSALVSMTVGYVVGPLDARRVTLPGLRTGRWNEQRLVVVVVCLLVTSSLALSALVARTGSFGLENLSAKRFVARYVEDYYAHGYLRLAAGISELAAYLLMAKVVSGARARGREFVFLGVSVALVSFSAVYQSSRGTLAFVVIRMIAISYYLRGRKINLLSLVSGGILSLVLIQGLTYLRGGRLLDESLIRDSFNLVDALNSVVVNRNFLDVSKTAHIVAAVPDSLGYQWGRTLTLWAVSWVPRSMWRGKPITSIGQILGPAVFGGSTRIGGGGVPPGIVAELYWNFSVPGVILGCFLVGYLLRVIYAHFEASSWSRSMVLLYVVGFMNLGMSLLGGDVTRTVISVLASVVPLYAILYFITDRSSLTSGENV